MIIKFILLFLFTVVGKIEVTTRGYASYSFVNAEG